MPVIDLTRVDAVIFDNDGVVTDTARLHAAAWKQAFDEFLRGRSEPFDICRDYLEYVDGRSRMDGVRTFLASRGIILPEGAAGDRPGTLSVHGLAAAKDILFLKNVESDRVAAFPRTVGLLRRLRRYGCRTGLVSASRHCHAVVTAAGVAGFFDTVVDGHDAATLCLPGKPEPHLFWEAARRLGVPPGRAAIVEDALAGVEAGRRGGFSLVIGVDRAGGRTGTLRARGADIVVSDPGELEVTGRAWAGAP
ncbi:HAD-IA family hydrolase [Sphaerisporangium sp. B11E5]|uniref:HAD family hydrolase n=1 Tax=Sphaerisporangium sp. B11E5 TaxID=3153563 RepID=UPI00325D4A52